MARLQGTYPGPDVYPGDSIFPGGPISPSLVDGVPIPLFEDGEPVRQADLNALTAHARKLYDATVGGFRDVKPAAMVVNTNTGIACPGDGIYHPLVWTGATYDSDDIRPHNTGDTDCHINTPGIYSIDAQVTLAAASGGATGLAGLRIYINGNVQHSESVAVGVGYHVPANGVYLRASYVGPFVRGGSILLAVANYSGVTCNLVTLLAPRITIEWLAPLVADVEGNR